MGIIFRLYFLSRIVIRTADIIREHTLRSDWRNSVYQIQNPQVCRGNLPQYIIFLNEILIVQSPTAQFVQFLTVMHIIRNLYIIQPNIRMLFFV